MVWFSADGINQHALKVYGYSSNWEERKIQEIYKRGQKKIELKT
jgi:hypothetical protein